MPAPADHPCGRTPLSKIFHSGLTAAADGSHTQGCMIALMPTPGDAARLAVPGGEPSEELHLTLRYLGKTDRHSPEARTALVDGLRMLARGLPPIASKLFGAAHWNGDGDEPSWVWSAGDVPDGVGLGAAHKLAEEAVRTAGLDVPDAHSPWVAHVCAAYSGDPALLPELEARLGEVTFDRIRVAFGDDDTDIPLTGDAITAAAGPLRREPSELETSSRADFTGVHTEWEAATSGALSAMRSVTASWRLDLRRQITRSLAADDPEALPDLALDTLDASAALSRLMEEYAVRAGRACQREAEAQGVRVPAWELPDGDALTAAVTGRRLLDSVARMTSDLMASGLLTAAKRKLSGLLRSGASPEAVASEVDRELADADGPGVRAAVGQAMTAAQNAGRHAVLDAAPPAQTYAASEILDRRTCKRCASVDGRTFATLASAVEEYPVMGYRECTGARYGNACRGFIIAVWPPDRADATAARAQGSQSFHGSPDDPDYLSKHPHGKRRGAKFTNAEHMAAMDAYSGVAYQDINGMLRSGASPKRGSRAETWDRVDKLLDMIDSQDPTTAETTVYRGTNQHLDLKPGDNFHDAGFVSTSAREDLSRDFAEDGSMFTIKVPPGSRMANAAQGGSVAPDEEEFVLAPGTKFKVTSVKPGADGEPTEYELEVVNA